MYLYSLPWKHFFAAKSYYLDNAVLFVTMALRMGSGSVSYPPPEIWNIFFKVYMLICIFWRSLSNFGGAKRYPHPSIFYWRGSDCPPHPPPRIDTSDCKGMASPSELLTPH